ncbi:GntR family transcriptional regulator [Sphingobacterium olei]|uniref:GntR family transcriptional regulator n=1 Tax=Sphingobacterium olei TaxID=2571155 RepID=A0A4U0NYY8_9SPHI|nr:GntR family transcriptional regulator [Sphingobacterium olei]TJZ59930.1 GntR family transcriptional regulator [Sphingobacterium olei]
MSSKFISISEEIIKRIKDGDLIPGDKVPSENDLIKTFNVSNTTARKSLLNLETLGWVRRIKGKGTFVLNRTGEHKIVRTLGSIESTRKGFNESLSQEGFEPKNIVIEKTILQEGISTMIQHKQLTLEGPVLKIHILRYADDEILKDETRYISLTQCPKIERVSPEISFFKMYEQTYNLKIKNIEQTLKTVIFDENTPENYFENEAPIAIFILDSAVIADDGNIIEIEHSFYSGDKYQFGIIAHPNY